MSKRQKENEKLSEKGKQYSFEEAVGILKQAKKVKFDETVEVHIRLGIDPKKTEQTVRGTVTLPNGIGKPRKIAVVAQGDKLKEAQDAGADFTGSDDLIEKISKGWMEFDVLIATPDMMRNMSKLGKLLGPRGLMPNPKAGTVTFSLKEMIGEFKLGRVEYKNDAFGIIHCPCGKLSFEKDMLVANIKALVEAVVRSKPPSSKGQFIKTISISSTMGPGLRISYEAAA